jgi:hypothetical protein
MLVLVQLIVPSWSFMVVFSNGISGISCGFPLGELPFWSSLWFSAFPVLGPDCHLDNSLSYLCWHQNDWNEETDPSSEQR